MTVLDQFKLTGKTALVTGGARGLGKLMATALAEAGADLALTGRSLESLQAAAAEIAGATGRSVRCFAGDVAVASDVEQLHKDVAAQCGDVDILINNAGTNIRGTLDQISEADWNSVIDTNLKGPFLVTKAFAPGMLKKGWGRVINLASIMSVIALPARTTYCSSKAGLLGLTRTWGLEWADKGVTCNAICPGPFATDMNRQLLNDPKAYQQFVASIPMGRWGELDELKGVVVFLASQASSFVTGASIFIDGGWTAR